MDVFKIIESWRNHQYYKDYLNPECSDVEIEKLQFAAKRKLKVTIPQSFVRLLKISNGIQINGAIFKKAENIVAENLDFNFPEVFVFGNSGNIEAYIFDKRDSKFHSANMFNFDEKFESYPTFEAMLLDVLKNQKML